MGPRSGRRLRFGVTILVLGLLAPAGVVGCGGGGGGGGGSRKPEIEITSFTFTLNGQVVNYRVEIANTGGRDARDFPVDIYFDRLSAPAPLEVGDGTQFVVLLAKGDTLTVPFSRFGTPPGIYNSWVQVDTDDLVAEKDETNNIDGPVVVDVPVPPAPDLTVSSLTAVATNLDVEYTMTVENQGTGDSGPFWVDLYYNETTPPGPSQPGDVFILVPGGLAQGSTLTFKRTRTGAPPGIYDSYAQADTLGQVPETDEGNNLAGPTQVTVAAPNTPELVLTSFTATAVGQDVTYDVTIDNIGLIDAGTFSVDLYYDRPTSPAAGDFGDDTRIVTSLVGGTSTSLVFTRLGAPTGAYQAWVQADTFNAVAESFENNNVGGPEGTLVGPELEIVYLRSDFNGPDVDYTVIVENFGSQDAGPFFLDLYYDWVVPPVLFDLGDDFAAPAGLAAGTMATFNFTAVSPVGDNFSWAQVDTDDQVTEVIETNNVKGSIFYNLLDTLSSELEITDVTATVTGPTTTYDITIRNNRGATASNFVVDLYLDRPVAPEPLDFNSSGFASIPTLDAGTSTLVSIPLTVSSGTYRSWVQVDADKRVVESNEGNNVYPMVPVTVP